MDKKTLAIKSSRMGTVRSNPKHTVPEGVDNPGIYYGFLEGYDAGFKDRQCVIDILSRIDSVVIKDILRGMGVC